MDAREQLIPARVGMLALTDELQNIDGPSVSAISRRLCYETKTAHEKYGRAGSIDAPALPDAVRDHEGARLTVPPGDAGLANVLRRPHPPTAATDRRPGQPGAGARLLA
jgi:hypothetical protein